ncbi:MAG TPA: transcriptional regulator NrdR [Clostridiales bacterium]|nr:transcriptional regulator NrdR [Clostridiales bacterium]
MKCVYCGSMDSKVIDSRISDDGSSIRRRRECLACGRRFTTYETVERIPVFVIKKDGNRELFDTNKLRGGIMKACEKRPVSYESIDKLVTEIEKTVYNLGANEVSSDKIGDEVMKGLKELDQVAYVRFASVYKEFKDIDTFLSDIERILGKKA